MADANFPREAALRSQPDGGCATASGNGPGSLALIELCGDGSELAPAERQALLAAHIIIYERSLAQLVAGVLPMGGYAEPAPAVAQSSDQPIFKRCLHFALDGWNVVQLMARRPRTAGAAWLPDAAAQLARAGVSGNSAVSLRIEPGCGGPLNIETPLHAAQSALDDRGLHGGLIVALGPIAGGPAPQVYSFSANGLAG
jgi:hypothetical protein